MIKLNKLIIINEQNIICDTINNKNNDIKNLNDELEKLKKKVYLENKYLKEKENILNDKMYLKQNEEILFQKFSRRQNFNFNVEKELYDEKKTMINLRINNINQKN